MNPVSNDWKVLDVLGRRRGLKRSRLHGGANGAKAGQQGLPTQIRRDENKCEPGDGIEYPRHSTLSADHAHDLLIPALGSNSEYDRPQEYDQKRSYDHKTPGDQDSHECEVKRNL